LAWAALAAFTLAGWVSRRAPIDAVFAQEGRTGGAGQAASSSAAVALARLLPASGLIAVGTRPGMRVVELKVQEGDQVAAGTVLAILEGHDAARAQRDLAVARKRLAEQERGPRLTAARKAAEITRRRLETGRTLYNQFAATLKGKDRYDAEMALYQVEMQDIKTQLDLELAQDSASATAGNPADAMLKAQVDLAESGLRDTEARATAPGRILRILAHPGETSTGVLLLMGDVSSMVAKAEVYQSDVPRIRPGDPAEVDVLGTRVPGKVARIGSIVGKNQLTSIDPRALRDLRVVEVTIQLDQPGPADRFVDMEVEAVIRPSGQGAPSQRGPG
jgi:HlyD family secretion protein